MYIHKSLTQMSFMGMELAAVMQWLWSESTTITECTQQWCTYYFWSAIYIWITDCISTCVWIVHFLFCKLCNFRLVQQCNEMQLTGLPCGQLYIVNRKSEVCVVQTIDAIFGYYWLRYAIRGVPVLFVSSMTSTKAQVWHSSEFHNITAACLRRFTTNVSMQIGVLLSV